MIIDKIFEVARRAPDKVAIHYEGFRVTYGEFAYWISHAHRFLARQNLRRGSIAVLLRVPSVLDSWALRFALNALGLTTVEVAIPEELDGLGLGNIGCVITTIADCAIRFPPENGLCKVMRIPWPLYLGQPAGPVPAQTPTTVNPGGHILLTSGTTGVKKKVLRDAAFDVAYLKYGCERYAITVDSIVNALDFAPWTAAGYGFPRFAWSVGAGVVFHQGHNLHRSFQIDGITHAFIIPMKLEEVLAAPERELPYNPNLRLLVGGAPLTWGLAAATKARFTPNVFHMIGSTEGGILTLTGIQCPDDLQSNIIVPRIDVQIVDELHRPLPAGQVGAIRVRPHEGLTGYLGDDPATSESFRDGYFYPGDLGEIRSDGRLVMHGRASNVTNLGGEKRAVEAIEQQMQDMLGADGICLLSLRGPSMEEVLHILIQSRRAVSRSEVLEALVRVAALSSAPNALIHRIDAIPRNEMGKIDRMSARTKISAGIEGRPAA